MKEEQEKKRAHGIYPRNTHTHIHTHVHIHINRAVKERKKRKRSGVNRNVG